MPSLSLNEGPSVEQSTEFQRQAYETISILNSFPCIVTWVLFKFVIRLPDPVTWKLIQSSPLYHNDSEGWGKTSGSPEIGMTEIVRTKDPSRLIMSTSGWNGEVFSYIWFVFQLFADEYLLKFGFVNVFRFSWKIMALGTFLITITTVSFCLDVDTVGLWDEFWSQIPLLIIYTFFFSPDETTKLHHNVGPLSTPSLHDCLIGDGSGLRESLEELDIFHPLKISGMFKNLSMMSIGRMRLQIWFPLGIIAP